MNKALSLILITLMILVLPVLSAAQTHALAHIGDDIVAIEGHHNHEHEDAEQHSNHRCCHTHAQVFSLPSSVDHGLDSSSGVQHITEYRFVVATISRFPEFRPPIV